MEVALFSESLELTDETLSRYVRYDRNILKTQRNYTASRPVRETFTKFGVSNMRLANYMWP